MATVQRYSQPLVPTYPFSNGVNMAPHNIVNGEATDNGFRRNKNTTTKFIIEQDIDESDNLDTIADSLPIIRRREKTPQGVTRRERSRKCLSVGAFECPPTLNKRISMYELGDYGWIAPGCDNGKNTLNLDQEINEIMKTNSVAEVNLGHIKIMF